MRTLSAALLAAQKSGAAAPFLRVRVIQKVGGIGRLDWQRLYTGAEADATHGAAQAGDGSLLRIRVSPGNTVQIQRVSSPGPGSDFATWPAGTGSNAAAVAICASGNIVWAFYSESAGGTVKAAQSTDYGATFGAWTEIAPSGTAPTRLAAAMKNSGEVLALFERGSQVYSIKRSGGAWGSQTAWTNSVATVTGLSACYMGDWNVVVSGQDASGNARVWTCLYGDGYSQGVGTWSSLQELTMAAAASSVQFQCPSLAMPDVFRLFFVEKYTGSGAYSRPCFSYSLATASYVDNLWREPVPFNLSTDYGVAVAYATGSYVWLSCPFGVWRASVVTGTGLDVTADVVKAHLWTGLFDGGAQVHLRNDDGRYASAGTGSLAPLQRGSQISLSPGYATTSGNAVSDGPVYWIEEIGYNALPAQARLVLEAVDGWGLLRGWWARRQFAWAAGSKNIFQLLSWVLARVGLELSTIGGGASTASQNQYPAFTIHAGESGAAAVVRLLSRVPDYLFFRGSVAYLFEPKATDAVQYSYGTDHPIVEGEYFTGSRRYNQVQVFGKDAFGEAFAWDEAALVYDRLRQVHDQNLVTASDCQARAQSDLRDEELAAGRDSITVAVNCGQELLDAVAVTEPRANLSAAKRRVMALDMNYDPSKGRYDQQLLLGSV
ncbi:MAG: hypothetical protein Q8R28_22935 [Dehalococcoidia bacterium]|nr:hypothetical protein [Dehalococcoidia bacterium]